MTIENLNQNFIGDVGTYHIFNTYFPYEVFHPPIYYTEGLSRMKVESDDLYEVSGGNPTVYFNGFGNYTMNFLIPLNIENCEIEVNMIIDKYQEKDKFILNNVIGDSKLIHVHNIIKEINLPILVQLDCVNWMNYKMYPSLEDNNSIAPIQRVAEDLIGSPLSIQVSLILQSLFQH